MKFIHATNMDHLQYPREAELAPIEVPFICEGHIAEAVGSEPSSPDQVLESFLDGLAECQVWYDCDSFTAASMVQAHIYFGLLRLAFGSSFRVESFVRNSDSSGRPVITLKELKDASWESNSDLHHSLSWLEYHVWPALPIIVGLARSIRTLGELGDVIGLSIEILAWCLARGHSPGIWARFKEGDILHLRMLDAGWCPYWTKIYCERFPPAVIYCLSGLRRSRHDHGACSLDQPCAIYDVDYNNYETKHAVGCQRQTCLFKGPDVKQLESIVAKGGIPLIRFSKKIKPEDGQLPSVQLDDATIPRGNPGTADGAVIEIDVVEHTFGRPFIAISHVWAGGLGHFGANTLPQCQLRFLYERARQCEQKRYGLDIFSSVRELMREHTEENPWLKAMNRMADKILLDWFPRFILGATAEDTSTLYLWIDTLCIPADPAVTNLWHLKRKAIDKMAQIYALAMHVLVIDETVQTLSCKENSNIAIAGMLMTCPWMSRCWTFQEACLSREFSFLLQDQLINPRKWRLAEQQIDISGRTGFSVENSLMREFLSIFRGMPDVLNEGAHYAHQNHPLSQFILVWNGLAIRRTSLPEDTHGILAVLLGLSVQEIFLGQSGTPRDPSQRMLAILRAQHTLPLSMLYFPYPENTPLCEGCKWVPRFPSGSVYADFGSMNWTTNGRELRISLPNTKSCAFILEGQFRGIDKEFRIRTNATKSKKKRKSGKYPIWIQLLPSGCDVEDSLMESRLCLILRRFNGRSTCRGACFSIFNCAESTPRLKFICPLVYALESSVEDQLTGSSESRENTIQEYRISQVRCRGDCFLECGKLHIHIHLAFVRTEKILNRINRSFNLAENVMATTKS